MSEIFGTYWTKKFSDIFATFSAFKAFVGTTTTTGTCGITPVLTEAQLTTTYYLLYAKYGNNIICNFDETQWKYKLASVIFINGKAWAKKLDIQNALASLDLNGTDILTSSTQIFNHAYNPSTAQSSTDAEITTINDQNVSKYKRGKLDAYSTLYELITNDVTSWYLDKFKNLFLQVLEPQAPLLYGTEEEDSE